MGFFLTSQVIQIQISLQYILSFWLSLTKREIEKLSAYECGLEPMGDARMKFDIQYYIIGILYLIFDLEIIFLFPQAAIQITMNSIMALSYALIFQTILTIGFIYEWAQGAQEIVR